MQFPEQLKYTQTHEWVKQGDDGLIWVGITDAAQDMLGDLVFVGDVKVGQTLEGRRDRGRRRIRQGGVRHLRAGRRRSRCVQRRARSRAAEAEFRSVRSVDLQDEERGADRWLLDAAIEPMDAAK